MENIEPKILEQVAQFEAYKQNMAAMNQIVAYMKEVPVLPSEIVPKDDNNVLKRVEFPEEGVLTYMDNYKYPYKGFPYYEFVEKIDVIKKICRQIQSGVYHGLKDRPKFVLYLLIPLIPILGHNLFYAFTYGFYRLIDRFRIKKERYCTAVREIHRAWSVEKTGESERTKEMRLMLRDIECMILEYDNAYRYRAQDVLPELDKQALQDNPVKEICRLLDIMISREKPANDKDYARHDSWRLLQMFTKYYMKHDKELLKIYVDLLLELDLNKVSLDEGDKEYCNKRKDYVFKHMN